jgi:hypothetical protein
MYDLPQITLDDLERFADWAELCALVDEPGVLSQTDVIDVVHDSGLLSALETDVFPSDVPLRDETQLSVDDSGDRFAETVWEELTSRSRKFKDAYPFTVGPDLLTRRFGAWENCAGYALLLIADISRHYAAKVSLEPRSKFQFLFEKVVEACAKALFGGTSVRFGWPLENDWPKPINDRIQFFGNRMRLVIELLEGKTKSSDKDRGLDVATRFSLGDDGPGTVIFLTQCATGKHWRKKRGEPSFEDWRDILQWQAKLIRAVAVPWRLDYPQDVISNFRHFDAVIIDRPRLNFGFSDKFLSAEVIAAIVEWCQAQALKFPVLKKGI